MKRVAWLLLSLLLASPAFADEGENANADAEGCKDNPLFNRLPGTHIVSCSHADFVMRRFPVGKPDPEHENRTSADVDVEGPSWTLIYAPNEGATPPSGLQIRRNFQAAVKKAGGSLEAEYPGDCNAGSDVDNLPGINNSCIDDGSTFKLVRPGKEIWAFVQHNSEWNGYALVISEREAMKQDIAVNEIVDEINKNGFIALYINFDTGKATIKPDSNKTLDDAAVALKAAPALNIEVAGHTDNVGSAEANQKLSEDRAKSVMAALVTRGIEAKRLTAKGYGQSKPVADNATDAGKAKNRRVELVKK